MQTTIKSARRKGMGSESLKELAIKATTGLMTLVFLGAGLTMVLGLPFIAEAFEHWGYPPWMMHTVGAFQIVAALALLVPKWTATAAFALSALMGAAMITHMMAGDGVITLMPMVLVALLLVVARTRGMKLVGAQNRGLSESTQASG